MFNKSGYISTLIAFATLAPALAAAIYTLVGIYEVQGWHALLPDDIASKWQDIKPMIINSLFFAYLWGTLPSLIFGRFAITFCNRDSRPSNAFLISGAFAFGVAAIAAGKQLSFNNWQISASAAIAIGTLTAITVMARGRA